MASERLPSPSAPGSVVLDIGGRYGALVVDAPAALDGEEVEIRPEGARWDGTHVAVRPRHLPGGVVHAGVFGPLPEGRYEIRRRHCADAPVVAAEVRGGRVSRVAVTDPGGPALLRTGHGHRDGRRDPEGEPQQVRG